ncbi:MAG: hypothetical protein K6G43_02500 [Lachnospiraceae bacterium]|nr:hypothetical protein [Lachnospiraceae bacterium]
MHFDPNTGEKIMDPGDEIQTAANTVNQAANQAAAQADAAAANQAAAAQAAAQAQAAQAAAQAQAAQAAAQAQAAQAAAQAQAAQAAAQAQAQFQQAQPQFQQAQPQFQQAQPQFQQAPVNPVPETKEKKGLPIGAIIGIIAVVAAVIGVVIFFVKGGIGGKVGLVNVFTSAYEGEYLTEYTKDFQIKPFGDFTYTVNGEAEDVEFSVSVASAGSSHTRSMYASVTYSGFTADATAYIDEKNIKAQVPILGDYVFLYDYSNDKNDGYLMELLDEADMDVKTLNALIAFSNDNASTVQKFYEKTLDYALACVNDIDFKKTGEKETFKVNGNDVSCKEYQAVITAEDVIGWIEGYQKVWDDFYKENAKTFEPFEEFSGEELDLSDAFDDMIEEIEDTIEEDIILSVYVKGKITGAIRFEYDENVIEVLFKGGDYLAQNVEVNYDVDGEDGTLLTIEGKTKGDVQTTTIEAEDEEFVLEYSFNRKTGELEMDMEEWGSEVYHIECTYTVSKGECKVVFDALEAYGQEMPFDALEVIVSNKADIQEPKKGTTFDLGNVDEDELEEFSDEVMETIEDNDELMDIIDELGLYYYF